MEKEIEKEIESVKGVIQRVMKDKTSEFYSEYKRLGGESSKPEFKKHLKRFFELTLNAYVYGSALNLDGTYSEGRDEVWNKWEDYIDDDFEADLYLEAVDNISPYT
jgi:hypothetical protein